MRKCVGERAGALGGRAAAAWPARRRRARRSGPTPERRRRRRRSGHRRGGTRQQRFESRSRARGPRSRRGRHPEGRPLRLRQRRRSTEARDVPSRRQRRPGCDDNAQARRSSSKGHCDNRGTIEYNLALGAKRAKAVQGLPGHAGHRGRAPLDHQLREGAAAVPRGDRGVLGAQSPRPLRASADETLRRAAPAPPRSSWRLAGCATRADLLEQDRRMRELHPAAEPSDRAGEARGRALRGRRRGGAAARRRVGDGLPERNASSSSRSGSAAESGSKEIGMTLDPTARRPSRRRSDRGAAGSAGAGADAAGRPHRRDRAGRDRDATAHPAAAAAAGDRRRVASRRGAGSGGRRHGRRARSAPSTSTAMQGLVAAGLRAGRAQLNALREPAQGVAARRQRALLGRPAATRPAASTNQAVTEVLRRGHALPEGRQGARGALAAGQALPRAWATRPTRASALVEADPRLPRIRGSGAGAPEAHRARALSDALQRPAALRL